MLVLTERLAVVDNLAGKIYLIVYADQKEPDAYGQARTPADVRRKLREPVTIPFQTAGTVTSSDGEFGADGYQSAVRRAANTSPQATYAGVVAADAASVRVLAVVAVSRAAPLNPSPTCYYDFGEFHVVGASPEILVRKEGDSDAAADRRHASRGRHAKADDARAALLDPRKSPST